MRFNGKHMISLFGVDSGAVAAALAILAGFRWLMRKWRSASIEEVFIRDMATNHLPHIYTALELIGGRVGVEIGESPQIRFLDEKDFEGK